jgi:hypothetical protein
MKTQCVYYEGGPEFLNSNQINVSIRKVALSINLKSQ